MKIEDNWVLNIVCKDCLNYETGKLPPKSKWHKISLAAPDAINGECSGYCVICSKIINKRKDLN